jgi:hypothetical protein
VLRTIEVENTEEGEVKGEAGGEGEEISAGESQKDESESPEQTAQSALRSFSNKHVSTSSVDAIV